MKKSLYHIAASVFALVICLSVFAGGITAGAASTTTTVAANYKDVVMIPSFSTISLCAEGYSNNFGTRELCQKKNGASTMHFKYVWQENYPINPDRALTALEKKDFDADMKVAPRYFRVTLKKEQKVGPTAASNFRKQTEAGILPGIIWGQNPVPTDTTSLPANTKKIYVESFVDSYGYTKKFPTTDSVNQAAAYVKKLAINIGKLHTARPKAQIYMGSFMLVTKSYPRIDNPKLVTDSMIALWGSMIGGLTGVDGKKFWFDKNFRTEVNKQIAAYCKANGFIFVDHTKAGITDSDGYLLEKYTHVNGIGYQLSQAGLTLFGDNICKTMGLPTAKQYYKLK